MSTNAERRIRILINPSARSGRGLRALQHLRGAAPDAPDRLRLEWIESRSAGHFQDLVQATQESDEEFAALGVAGGDGTVTMALTALAQMKKPARVPLGVLPTGSGNDFANDIGASRDLRTAFGVLLHGAPRKVDIGEARTPEGALLSRFCCVASVGLDELALKRIHGSRWPRSKLLNVYSALLALAAYRPQMVTVRWAGGAFCEEVMFCAVTNTRSYGGGFQVCPGARIDDGELDICIVRKTSKARLLAQFPRILRGTHDALPEVLLLKSSWVELDSGPLQAPLPLCVDGELPSAFSPTRLTCLPGALWVMAPVAEAQAVPSVKAS